MLKCKREMLDKLAMSRMALNKKLMTEYLIRTASSRDMNINVNISALSGKFGYHPVFTKRLLKELENKKYLRTYKIEIPDEVIVYKLTP
jgi:hypothetical protein